jgi:hypothetical protein
MSVVSAVVGRVLLRRNIIIEAGTAQLVVAASRIETVNADLRVIEKARRWIASNRQDTE